jgi:hypothetical protein
MFGAGRSVAGSHLINLRRQRASSKSTQTITEFPPGEHGNSNPASNIKTYVISGFAKFEFRPGAVQQHDIGSRAFPPRFPQVNIFFQEYNN